MPSAASQIHVRPITSLRAVFRSSEAALVVLAIGIGIAAGVLTILQNRIAHGMQSLIYGLNGESLSASATIAPLRLLALPIFGLILGFGSRAVLRRWRTPVDVVEANALHGGAIPWQDSLLVCVQTLISNGAGASVGLEAAYGQAGGGFASIAGQWLRLRRADMRILVGAGAGAAIAAAFGAPLTGAFYGFEIVIGAYTPAAIAPVGAACLSAVLLVRFAGLPAYVVALPGARAITTEVYVLYAIMGILCAAVAIGIMRMVALLETRVRGFLPDALRPAIGGLLLIPIAMVTPQALSAGHGALHTDLGAEIPLGFILTIFLAKIAASAVSLGFGFRGGLFFASLFIGSLAGQLFVGTVGQIGGLPTLDPTDAALIGMAAMAVAIVGGPMTMSMLVLETTHDFALTGVAIMAGLCASTVVRETFGFSFSTWRLHTRGESIRSARDVGWVRNLTAGRMMQRAPDQVPETMKIEEFQRRFPLGSTGRVVATTPEGHYAGMVETVRAFSPDIDPQSEVGSITTLRDVTLDPAQDVGAVMAVFDASEAPYLAVVNEEGEVVGTLAERFVQRRYANEMEKAHREAFGE
jgi:CIC family chloride channel protein